MKQTLKTIALCGNPNVGKSTVFNALTGLKQHTGNWSGKTVELSYGTYNYCGTEYTLVDLPGTYSFSSHSREEEIAGEFITNKNADVFVVVCDASALERNLHIILRTLELSNRVIIALNMMDEAEKQGMEIDVPLLEKELNAPIIAMSARLGWGIDELKASIREMFEAEKADFVLKASASIEEIYEKAKGIYKKCVHEKGNRVREMQLKTDKLITNKYIGIPLMLLCFGLILFITIIGANYPSQLLSRLLLGLEDEIMQAVLFMGMGEPFAKMLVEGGYRVLAWVVSVMLPPMAIFFPLFTLLEDWGFLPRIAFNLDGCFKRCNACGKQALTMCMGLGCNAVGVVGCRIIDSKRERLIAILTNSLMPCNGRFPLLISIITMFLVGGGSANRAFQAAILLLLFIVFAVIITFLLSKLLSKTLLKGMLASFTLELPPYRRPQFKKVIVRSVIDRILVVLSRAAAVAFPAGIVLYIVANVSFGDATLFEHISNFLEPFARIIGLDGIILLAFLLAFPANEIVMPIIIMGYLASGSISEMPNLNELYELLVLNGWSITTAFCMLVFTLFHWPCSTTLLTIKKETGSIWWTLLAVVLPTLVGLVLCGIIAFLI